MAQAVGKYAAKKLLSRELTKYKSKDVAGPYDPYYTYIEHPRKPGKKKKVKKQIPDYIDDNDAMILAKVRKRAYMLDCSLFNFLGQRFGWSSVVGIIPFIGDGADSAMALLMVYHTCTKVTGGLPISAHLVMLINIAVDFLIGLIPFLGDIFDATFKANSRNVRVLEKLLDQRYKPKAEIERQDRIRREKRASGMRYESPPPATVIEDIEDQQEVGEHRIDGQDAGVVRPSANQHTTKQSETTPAIGGKAKEKSSGGGWFSWKKQRHPDEETGVSAPPA